MCACRSYRLRVRSVGRNRRNTERVPGRVEKHAPSSAGLRVDLDSAQAHRSCRRLLDVRASRQIEMDDRRARPNRWNVGSDPLRNKCDSGNPHARAVRVLPEQLPAEQVEVERGQGGWVCTVERHSDEAECVSVCVHTPTLRHTAHADPTLGRFAYELRHERTCEWEQRWPS